MATVSPERETVKAQARYVRTSARKARLVLEHIRGKSAVEARDILSFHTRAAARDAGKVLASAIANAENNNGHDVEDLVVAAAYADEGPTLKRWRPRARGRVNRIEKRTCHITITLGRGRARRDQAPRAPPGGRARCASARRPRPSPSPRSKRPTRPLPRRPRWSRKLPSQSPSESRAPRSPRQSPRPKRPPRPSRLQSPKRLQSRAEPEAEPEAAPEPEPETEPTPEAEAEDQPSDTKDDQEASS